ncbi:hypothetical protein SDC9_185344 [bioreactor metagenome]|uniref:Uncharacterized protein n=1 Tax=bioreactor metagenome TaxID=1076179 RepID=A0A645HR41_9ZZZZ
MDSSVFPAQEIAKFFLAFAAVTASENGVSDLIVQLPCSDVFIRPEFLRQTRDQFRRVFPVDGGRVAGMIAHTEIRGGAVRMTDQDFRMLFHQPCGSSRCGRGKNDLDPGLAQNYHGGMEPAESIFAFPRFQMRPCEFTDADEGDSPFPHQLCVKTDPFLRPGFRIVGSANFDLHWTKTLP